MAYADDFISLFAWAVVMLIPLLIVFLRKPAWAKVFCYVFVYPMVLGFLGQSSYFQVNKYVIFTAALLTMGVAALLLINPTIKERVSDPENSTVTAPAYYAGLALLFLILVFGLTHVPYSPFYNQFYLGQASYSNLAPQAYVQNNKPQLPTEL
jgi:hypothetical protein